MTAKECFKRVKRLCRTGAPPGTNTLASVFAKRLMLSRLGTAARRLFPSYQPVCTLFPRNIVVLSNGKVTTCCHDPLGKNAFDSVYQRNLGTILSGLRARLKKDGLYSFEQCRQCIGGNFAPITSTKSQRATWLNCLSGRIPVLTVEVMGACNYGCCITRDVHKYRSVKPDLDKVYAGIRDTLSRVDQMFLFNYGEPLLHDGFNAFISRCRASHEEMVMTLCTNGYHLNDEIASALIGNRINHVIVSVHGAPGTENMLKYSRHGADYERVVSNVAHLIKSRNERGQKKPAVQMRAILFNWNDSDEAMNTFRSDMKAIGLTPAHGDWETDNYHWILDAGPESAKTRSKRFIRGSAELETLKSRGELGN